MQVQMRTVLYEFVDARLERSPPAAPIGEMAGEPYICRANIHTKCRCASDSKWIIAPLSGHRQTVVKLVAGARSQQYLAFAWTAA